MNISLTIPDAAISAWQYRVDQYNEGSNEAPVTIAEFCQLTLDGETSRVSTAYESYKLTQLIPLGKKFDAAPSHVQDQVDALLAPYNG